MACVVFIGSALCPVLLGDAATAAQVTIGFNGQIDYFRGCAATFNGAVQVGGAFTGEYTFGSTTPDSRPDDAVEGYYESTAAGSGMVVRIGPLSFGGTTGSTGGLVVWVRNNTLEYGPDNGVPDGPKDLYYVSPGGFPLGQSGYYELALGLQDLTATALASDALPLDAVPSASAAALGTIRRGGRVRPRRHVRVRALCCLRSSTLIQRGEVADGLRRCDEALALSPIPFDAAAGRAIRGYGLVKLGRTGDGVSALEEALGWYERSQLRYTRTQFSLWLAEGELRGGDCARARRLLEEAIEVARSLGYRHLEGVGLRLLGQALAVEAPATAAAQLDAALDILEETGAMNEVAKTLGAQGDLLHGGAAPGAAHLLWARALRIYEELGTLDEPIRLRAALSTRDEKGG